MDSRKITKRKLLLLRKAMNKENEKEIYFTETENLFKQYKEYLDEIKKEIKPYNSDIYLHQANLIFDKYNESLKELKKNIIEEKEKEFLYKYNVNKWIMIISYLLLLVIIIGIGSYCMNNYKYVVNNNKNIEIQKLEELNKKIDKQSKITKKYFYDLKHQIQIKNNKSKSCCININCNKGN